MDDTTTQPDVAATEKSPEEKRGANETHGRHVEPRPVRNT